MPATNLTIKQEKFCSDCGRNLDLVGRMHRCVPMPGFTTQVIYGGSAGGGMSETVNNTKQPLLTTSAQRQSKWRKANPELNRQRAREGMRKLRAAHQ